MEHANLGNQTSLETDGLRIVKYGWQKRGSSDEALAQNLEMRREQLLQLMPEFMDEGLDIDCCHPLIEEWMALLKERDHLLHRQIKQENEKILEEYLQQLNWILKQLNRYEESMLTPEFQRNIRLIQKDVARYFHMHQIIPHFPQSPVLADNGANKSDQKIYTEKEEMGLNDSLILVDKSEGTDALKSDQKETQTAHVLPPGEGKETQTNVAWDNELKQMSAQPLEACTETQETQTHVVNTLDTSSQAVEDDKVTATKETQADCQGSINGVVADEQNIDFKETQTPTIEVQHNFVQPEEAYTDIKETQTRVVETLNTSSQATEDTASKHTQSERNSVVNTEASIQTTALDVQVTSSQTDQMNMELKETQTMVVSTSHTSMQTELKENEVPVAPSVEVQEKYVVEDIAESSDGKSASHQHVDDEEEQGKNVNSDCEESGQKKADIPEAETSTSIKSAKQDDAKPRRKKNKSKRSKLN